MPCDKVFEIGISQSTSHGQDTVDTVIQDQSSGVCYPFPFVLIAPLVVVGQPKGFTAATQHGPRITHVGRVEHTLTNGLFLKFGQRLRRGFGGSRVAVGFGGFRRGGRKHRGPRGRLRAGDAVLPAKQSDDGGASAVLQRQFVQLLVDTGEGLVEEFGNGRIGVLPQDLLEDEMQLLPTPLGREGAGMAVKNGKIAVIRLDRVGCRIEGGRGGRERLAAAGRGGFGEGGGQGGAVVGDGGVQGLSAAIDVGGAGRRSGGTQEVVEIGMRILHRATAFSILVLGDADAEGGTQRGQRIARRVIPRALRHVESRVHIAEFVQRVEGTKAVGGVFAGGTQGQGLLGVAEEGGGFVDGATPAGFPLTSWARIVVADFAAKEPSGRR